MDQDDIVLMPLRAFQRRIAGNTDIATIYVSARDGVETAKVQADIERLLRERRKVAAGEEDDFYVRDMRQVVEVMTGTTVVLTGLLGAVAAVSLFVGGIGIMNIMLVSVTERTREIGIRLAIGALERQVLFQFLVEAVVLSLFGGFVGIVHRVGACCACGARASDPLRIRPDDRRGRFPVFRHSRRGLRLCAGTAGGAARPDRSLAPRIAHPSFRSRNSPGASTDQPWWTADAGSLWRSRASLRETAGILDCGSCHPLK